MAATQRKVDFSRRAGLGVIVMAIVFNIANSHEKAAHG
jgi:hypothetical protein